MNKVDKIPWKRIAVEATAIVSSILLAFAIDAWWGNRLDRVALVEYLISIEAELVENQESADLEIRRANEQLLAVNRVLSVLANDEENLGTGPFEHDLGAALWFGDSLHGMHSSVDALTSSNQFGAISNFGLIRALNEVTWAVHTLSQIIDREVSVYFSDIVPMLERYSVMSNLGSLENWRYTRRINEQILATPEAPYTIDEAGMRSQETWNTIFNWKLILLDRRYIWAVYVEKNADLLDEVRSEVERHD